MIRGFQVRYTGPDSTFRVERRRYTKGETVRASLSHARRFEREYGKHAVVERWPGHDPVPVVEVEIPQVTMETIVREHLGADADETLVLGMTAYLSEQEEYDVEVMAEMGMDPEVADALATAAIEFLESTSDEEDDEDEDSEDEDDDEEEDDFSLDDAPILDFDKVVPNLGEDGVAAVTDAILKARAEGVEITVELLTEINGVGKATALKLIAALQE